MKKTILTFAILLTGFNINASETETETLTLESSTNVPTFIELYTSQGCSSCPPADRYLNSLKKKKGLFTDFIPMAFHVDYWDYLGWKDPFASAQHSNRQRLYKARNKSNSVYTPQFIVSDQEWRGFFKRRKADLNSQFKNPKKLSVEFDGREIKAEYAADKTFLYLHTAILGIGTETSIPRGENAGRTLKQDFIVLSHETFRSDNNTWQFNIQQPKASVSDIALVTWISTKPDSRPLQAVASYIPESILKL